MYRAEYNYFILSILVFFASVTYAANNIHKEVIDLFATGDTAKTIEAIKRIPKDQINYPVNRHGYTLLHVVVTRSSRSALTHHRLATIKALLDAGIDVNRANNSGQPALFLIRDYRDSIKDIKILIQSGADLSLTNQYNRTYLHNIIKAASPDTLNYLLQSGAKPDPKDINGVTPLMIAAKSGNITNMKILINAGADINSRDNSDNGLMYYAAKSSSIHGIDFFISKGLAVDQRGNKNTTALSVLASSRQWALVRILLERGANPNAPMGQNGSVAQYIIMHPELNMSSLITGEDIDINAPDKSGASLIFRTINSLDIEGVKRLIKRGVNVNDTRTIDHTSLSVIVQYDPQRKKQTIPMINLLIKHGVDLDAEIYQAKITAIMLAAQNGYYNTVKILIEAGADLELVDGLNNTALDYSIQFRHFDIALLLYRSGLTINYETDSFWSNLKSVVAELNKERNTNKPDSVEELFKIMTNKKVTLDLRYRRNQRAMQIIDDISKTKSELIIHGLSNFDFTNKALYLSQKLPVNRDIEARSVARFEEEERVTKPPRRKYDKSAQLHVIGIYQGKKKGGDKPWWANCDKNTGAMRDCHRKYAGQRKTRTVRVTLIGKKKPVILTLMAYEPVHWAVSNTDNAKIDGIILTGYHGQSVSGINPDVPVDVYTYKQSDCGNCQKREGYFYAYKASSNEYKIAAIRLKDITGQLIKTFQGRYTGEQFVILNK